MPQKKYILTIPEPCHEQWSQMTPCGAGRFCASCQKTVMDFTPLSDDSIVRILESSQGKICGRFQKNQLNRIVAQTETQPPPFSRMLKIAAGILLPTVLHPTILKSQEDITIQTTEGQHDSLSGHGDEVKQNANENLSDRVFQGRVLDAETKEPLVFASIVLLDKAIDTITDIEGKFRMEIPVDIKDEKMKIQISYIGYENDTLEISQNDLAVGKDINIELTLISVRVGGACVKVPKTLSFREKARRFFTGKY